MTVNVFTCIANRPVFHYIWTEINLGKNLARLHKWQHLFKDLQIKSKELTVILHVNALSAVSALYTYLALTS